MHICLTCSRWAPTPLCAGCRSRLRRAGPLTVGQMRVASGLMHSGPARRLVHLLKYGGIDAAAMLLAKVMAGLVPADAAALVPIPRALLRRVRYGVDPAHRLARVVAAETGLPVVDALVAPLWWPSHAGSDRHSRNPPQFRTVGQVPAASVLVDDVLTTGATAAAAAQATGSSRVLTATRADSGSFG